jgi:3-methyladenine DNA glycosylase/8-oxoguanine DNA glycosylase
MQITTPRFNFPNLIHSHGWYHLAPFSWNPKTQTLSRPLQFQNGTSASVTVSAKRNGTNSLIQIDIDRKLNAQERQEVRHQVRRMLSLDEDLSTFHLACKQDPLLRFVHRNRSGGMLRSPTAFEDVIKTICTTNCSWQNTRSMCQKLCELASGNFPSPAQLSRYSPTRLATKVPLGYRSKTVLEIARLTIAGDLPLDEWAHAKQFDRIKSALENIWGIGPYALSHILMLLGDYSTIPVDSEVLKYLSHTHFAGAKVKPKDAVKPYENYGNFQFLAFKFARMARKMKGRQAPAKSAHIKSPANTLHCA